MRPILAHLVNVPKKWENFFLLCSQFAVKKETILSSTECYPVWFKARTQNLFAIGQKTPDYPYPN